MPTTVRDVMALMETMAPRWMACDKDPVGLHAGDPKAKVKSILVALDATLPAVREAKRKKCQMIVAHHPRIYRPLTTLDESTMMGAVLAKLVRAKLALFCAHTNLDAAPGGVNDILADLAGLSQTEPLDITGRDGYLKLAVFVPDGHIDAVRDAICDAGAGCIGEYDDCTFRAPGIGSFRGSDATKPFLGVPGVLEQAEEWRLETILPASARTAVLQAMTEAHPYEEVAYDLYPLDDGASFGLGRVGELKKAVSLKALAARMKKATTSPGTLVLGDPKKPVKRLAVWSGGGCPVARVVQSGADAVVLGETDYHSLEVLQQASVGCVMLGHGPCEEIVLPWLAENLRVGLGDVAVHVYTDGTPKMWSL